MWRGRILEIIGLWLIFNAFMQRTPETTALVNMCTGGMVAILGVSLRHVNAWHGLTVGIAGALLIVMAFVSPFTVHYINLWGDLIAGILVWLCGKRIVSSEIGGPWRLKDGPVY